MTLESFGMPPIAPGPTILRGIVGSTVHGLALDGTDDRDEMGVCVESPMQVIGLRQFEQIVYRTAAEREHRVDAKSQHGDLDLVVYSLRKYCRLALNGNPTILVLLFLPEASLTTTTSTGMALRALAPYFASRRVVKAFLGYLHDQKQRLLGERGQKRTHRPELDSQHGYDTKYAMHMLRLGFQGLEYLDTQRLSLPMPEPERDFLMRVRRGEINMLDVIDKAKELEDKMRSGLSDSALPTEPNQRAVDLFLIDTYRDIWGWR